MENWELIAMELGFKSEEEMFKELYLVRKLTTTDISKLCKVTNRCTRKRLVNLGIKMRPRGGAQFTNKVIPKEELLKDKPKELCQKYQQTKWSVYSRRWRQKKRTTPTT